MVKDATALRKTHLSKRKKKSWNVINTGDVDEFLDKKRLEERIGGPVEEKKNEELFVIDDIGNTEQLSKPKYLSKKEKARLPVKCYENLRPLTAVPDPISKRNRVRTKEERKSDFVKQRERIDKLKGVVRKKELQARKDRARSLRLKRLQPEPISFDRDIWNEQDKGLCPENEADPVWLREDTVRHTLANTRRLQVSVPPSIRKKTSIVAAVEAPHPGLSYNPSYKDHQALLKEVADRELALQKEERHIARCTTELFTRVTATQKQAGWFEEMSQGLNEPDVKEETPEGPLSVNPPSNRLIKKTLKQRRKMREQMEAAQQREEAKVEKKKVADIYKLKFINEDIAKIEKKKVWAAKRRAKLAEVHAGKPKRLALKKFEEPELAFNRQCELRNSLRAVQKNGSLLADRFYSLQKRNILPPSNKLTRFPKAKVKKYVKPSHKMEGVNWK